LVEIGSIVSETFKNVSVSAVLYPRWPPLLKIEISSNDQDCSILSQKVPKFELYKHNDELFNIYYGIYVKLSSAVAAILVGVLKCRTQFWKRTTQESFQQSLVEIGSVVSEEKIFFQFHPPFFLICIFRTPTKMAATAELNLT
jgi:UV DNA damage repair endonuclease